MQQPSHAWIFYQLCMHSQFNLKIISHANEINPHENRYNQRQAIPKPKLEKRTSRKIPNSIQSIMLNSIKMYVCERKREGDKVIKWCHTNQIDLFIIRQLSDWQTRVLLLHAKPIFGSNIL